MKKFIVVVGSPESKDLLLQSLNEIGVKDSVSLNSPIIEHIPASLRIAIQDNQPFEKPIQLTETHLRLIFSKLQTGVISIQNYIGKVVNSPAELVEYVRMIGGKGYGNEWLVNRFLKDLEYIKDGTYIFKDLKDDELLTLKENLKNQIITMGVAGTEDEKLIADYVLKPEKSSAAFKKTLKNTIKQIQGR